MQYPDHPGREQQARSVNVCRDYAPDAVNWLRYIRLAQSLGFTLMAPA